MVRRDVSGCTVPTPRTAADATISCEGSGVFTIGLEFFVDANGDFEGELSPGGQVSGTVDAAGNVEGTALYGGATCDFSGTSDEDSGCGTVTCASPACTGTWDVVAEG